MTTNQHKLRTFEAIANAVAAEEAKRMTLTPHEEAAVQRLYAAGRRMMAQHRYKDRDLYPVTYLSPEIRPEIRAMSPVEVKAGLAGLRADHSELQSAHREGDHLSDDDLRAMLEDATKVTKDKE